MNSISWTQGIIFDFLEVLELKTITRVDKEDLRKDDPRLLTFITVSTENELKNAEGCLWHNQEILYVRRQFCALSRNVRSSCQYYSTAQLDQTADY